MRYAIMRNLTMVILGVLSFSASNLQSEEWLTEIRREVRTDTVAEKLNLIEQANQSGRYDLAMSLAESLKDTLKFERQINSMPEGAAIELDSAKPVDQLPKAWAEWAKGWQKVQALKVSDAASIARVDEPVDLLLSIANDDSLDLHRELRVAQADHSTGMLREIRSQVYDMRRRGDRLFARVVFFADVPAGGSSDYLLFYGNPQAELPRYVSDLKVDGDHFDLDITNQHFVATLSDQTGQLERLRYTRQHGLELYSGGKGHGEPPTIDWSNDYVDPDHYQKLRIRNWAEPPNYEVIRGPLMVRVRRWGFPHSPMHLVFTPSRMHIDQTYTFFASKDYLLKEGTMEAAKDFPLATMRDDEWVLSGYSFTEKLWLDSDGHLREGDVPADQHKQLQGVGFYNRDSRDAFLALWLEHLAEGIGPLERNGLPTLHYFHHGQLWSRYPLGSEPHLLKQGTVLRQRNAYLATPYSDEGFAEKIENVRRQFLNPVTVGVTNIPSINNPQAIGTLAREGETPDYAPLKKQIWQAMRKVLDEQFYHIDSNVVDMGLIYDVRVRDDVVEILMTMPDRGRPIYQFFEYQGGGRITPGIRERLLMIEGIKDVLVHHTWYPQWTVDRLSRAGRKSLGLDSSKQ